MPEPCPGNVAVSTRHINQAINQYFIVHQKVDQRAGQLSLSHVGITKAEKNRTKT